LSLNIEKIRERGRRREGARILADQAVMIAEKPRVPIQDFSTVGAANGRESV
jgi:hypothetical protein